MSRIIKIKVALAVDPSGKWNASGWGNGSDETFLDAAMDIAMDGVEEGEKHYVLEALIEVPSRTVVQADVEEKNEQ